MRTRDGRLKILDFGLARIMDDALRTARQATGPDRRPLTRVRAS